ncbi:MAG: efflux RND transporter permease subunit [Candidatus Omnitrophota bacterium]|jgi:HAE1 family hydrophobic/amphiphilic exporter-1|nr:MAG: efflux RND transporter permease subunit [Candidatus Omnitrophota bacterium]
MSISHFAIRRPVTTTMFFLMVVLFGVVSFIRLPIDLMPDITYPAITVATSYEHVGPEEMEQLITRPIEETVSSIQGVEKITSTSTEGSSSVRVGFMWGTDLDNAANDIRARVDRIRDRLPEDADSPVIWKFDLSAFPVLFLGVSGRLDPVEMRDLVEHQIKYRLERVPGVAAIDIRGGLKREIHVDLDRRKLTALDLSLNAILAALKSDNLNLPAGKVDDGDLRILVRTKGEFANLEEIANTVVQVRDGVPILLKDLGIVEDSHEEITYISRSEGVPVLRMFVNKQSGSNTVEVVEGIIEEIKQVNIDFPQITVFPTLDTADYIKRAIANVRNAAMYGAILAAFILLFFLRNLTSTLIISIAIPISITATFALMYFYGFTLNIMTFGGLALGVGMLVDSAIVVLENIFRHCEGGKAAREAAEQGTEEVSSAIVASTLTTLVVFLPVVFVRGISGVTFKQLAAVVVFALFCSLIVALTLIPVMSARFLKRNETSSNPSKRGKPSGFLLSFIEREYLILLHTALHHRTIVIFLALALLGGSIWLSERIGVEFMPKADENEIRINGEMAVGTRLEVVDATFQEIENIVRNAVPEATIIYSRAGSSGWRSSGGHTGEVRVTLLPVSERKRSGEQICRDLRPLLAHIPGTIIRVREGQGLFVFRLIAGGEEAAEVQVRGYDLDISRELALRVKAEMEQVEGITDVLISREEGQPEEVVRVDRAKAAAMGLSVSSIAHAIETSLSGTSATMYRDGGDEYKILVRLKESDRLSVTDVLDMTIASQTGHSVVLKNVVRLERREGPMRIEREDQQRIITISGNISDRDLGSVMKNIEARIDAIPIPADFEIIPSGEYEEQQKAFLELLLGFCLAIILVYMVMASQFESLIDPFVVMFSIPFATIGVVLTLILTNTTFSVQSFIGCIMLAGIVVNNAIILVDYTNLLRRRDGFPLMDAIEESARRRLRPILMTTLTTAVGLAPMALGLGEGGEVQSPMARVVIGGLLSSSLITLVLIPTLYSIFERKEKSA